MHAGDGLCRASWDGRKKSWIAERMEVTYLNLRKEGWLTLDS
jgi:Leu/Phe-tRNA-protein transferase